MISTQGYNEPWPGFRAPIVTRDGRAVPILNRWFDETLQERIKATPVLPQAVSLETSKSAATSGTVTIGNIAGLYRVSVYAQVRTAAGVSSSWQVTVTWTYGGQAQTEVFALVNGNSLTTHQGLTFTVRCDAGTPIGYSIAYASNPAGAMVYDAAVCAELLQSIAG